MCAVEFERVEEGVQLAEPVPFLEPREEMAEEGVLMVW